jgi:two-component system, LytTR family, response regulator
MSTRMTAYLVDDELPALKRLARLLEETGRVEVIGSSINPAEAIDAITAEMPDILFLDIQMPVIDGFELLSRLPKQPIVIFATAYDHYALRAFEVNSIDYLLKPIEPDQLDRALNKLDQFRSGARPEWLGRPDLKAVLEELSRTINARGNGPWDRIPIQLGERTRFLELPQITHFFTQDRLTYVAAEGKTYCIDSSIADLEERLAPSRFVRVHRGALVNLDWIDELTPFFSGRLVLRLRDEKRTEITVSRDRVRAVKERLGL